MNEARVSEFGGLELVSDPETVGWKGAIDLLNVDFDRRGRVRVRDGSEVFSTSDATDSIDNVFPYYGLAAGNKLLVVSDTTSPLQGNIQTVSASGTVSAATTWSGNSASVHFAHFGSPTETAAYFTRPTASSANTIGKYDGTSFSAPTATVDGVAARAMPLARLLAVTPNDNRLVATGFFNNTTSGPNAATSNPYRVYFSDAGQPETWDTDNWVDLHPGDGQPILAIGVWREFLFVFKERKFFVFYGNSTDSTGSPVFNYRTVDAGIGVHSISATTPRVFSVAAGPDGLYFIGARGVYRTTGGLPELVSQAIDPFFVGGASSFWQGGSLTGSSTGLVWLADRLYWGATIDDMFVYDPIDGYWTYWDNPASRAGLAAWKASASDTKESLYFAVGGRVHRFNSTLSADAGTAIVSRYRSGFHDLGTEDPKTIRRTRLYGTGTVTLGWSEDFGAIASSAGVTLGTSPAVRRGEHTKAIQGSLLSYELSASSGAWAVSRVVPMLRDNRRPVAATRPVAA